MSEEKKAKAEKKIGETEKKSPPEEKKLAENDLSGKLKAAVEDLYYTSETDAPFEPFVWERGDKSSTDFTAPDVLRFAGEKSDAKIEEKSLDDFFSQPTTIQDWFEDEEKAQVEKFLRLKETLAGNLKNIKVFRVGETEINIYIIGIDADGNLAGVKTRAVET